jgi:integrase
MASELDGQVAGEAASILNENHPNGVILTVRQQGREAGSHIDGIAAADRRVVEAARDGVPPLGVSLDGIRLAPVANRVRRSLGTNNEATAEILAADQHRKALIGDIVGHKESISLDHALGRYVMDHGRHLPSLQTIAFQAKSLRRLIGKTTPLSAIDDAVVASFVARRRGEKARRGKSSRKNRGSVAMDRLISNSTVNKEISLLRAVMNMARIEWKLTVGEVDWRKRRLRERDSDTRWLTEDQVRAVIASGAPHLRAPMICALSTGLRSANVMRLDWSQVDMRQRMITVRIKSRKPGGKLLKLPIVEPLFIALANIRPKDQGRVFLYRGRPIKTDVRRAFLTALRKASVGPFTWHHLRHTAASWMVQKGKPLAAVRDVLGHSDITLTQRYAHMAPGQIDDAMAVLGEALTDTPLAQQKLKKAANA